MFKQVNLVERLDSMAAVRGGGGAQWEQRPRREARSGEQGLRALACPSPGTRSRKSDISPWFSFEQLRSLPFRYAAEKHLVRQSLGGDT